MNSSRCRIPVILQMDASECGVACLTMVLNCFGRKTHLTECCRFFDAGRDGVTAKTIANAARDFGLRVKAYSASPHDFQHIQLPAIIHWNFNHFVVVEKWSSKKVVIVDPSAGRRQLMPDEFDSGFTGVVLTFEPGVRFEYGDTEKTKNSWFNYLKSLLCIPGASGVLAQILGASLLLQVFGLALPIFTKVLVDNILPLRIANIMTILGIGIIIIILSQVIISYLRAALLVYLQGRLDSHMMLGFFEHILSLPYRFFQQRTSGDLLMRLGSNMRIREALTNQTISAVLDGSFVLVYLAILLFRDTVFGVFVFGFGMLQVVIVIATTRWVHVLTQQDLDAQAESQSYLVEALTGIVTLKASGTEDRAFDYWSNLFFKSLNISLRRSHFLATIDTIIIALRTFAPLLLLWVGALRVLNGSMSLGTMLALNAIGILFLTPLASLVSNGQQLQLVGAHLDRIADVVEAEPEQSPRTTHNARQPISRIDMSLLDFHYDKNAPLVLRDISLSIKSGQKVALVGRTGSGKTTLAMLLLGLYTPTKGRILYNGIPMQRMNYRALRSQFGVVLQESFLFNGSIRQNIAFNNPAISLEEVIEAARTAGIHDEIMGMPMGYETIVAERGAALSGGQRQRLSIARALAHKPAILLLDEATSHLDALTEDIVDRNLNRLSCIRIVIAHRLSTIRNADLILVIDKGEIVEQGSHDELITYKGHYTELVNTQLER
jgi:ATP-binding cassette subfamily B protein